MIVRPPGRRLRGAAFPLLVAVGLLVSCGTSDPGTDSLPTPATLECRSKQPVTSVVQINDFIATTRQDPNFVGADVGASTALSDGRTMWVFGDTLRSPDFAGPQFVRNSMLILSDHKGCVVMPADKGAVIPNRADGVGYWPMSIASIATQHGDSVGLGLMRVKQTGPGTFDFQILGPSVARLSVQRGGAPMVVSVTDVGKDRVDDGSPMWGAAVVLTDSWIYLYGTSNPDPAHTAGWSLHVARTTLTDLRTPQHWEYWDGSGWSHDAASVSTLIPYQRGVSRVLSVFRRGGQWYAVSKRNDVLGTDLVVWKAPGPTGPFVAGPAVAQIPSDDGLLQYMPLAHPEVLPEPGTVVVSWSRNVGDPHEIQQDPELYRPMFKRVPLP